MKNTTKCSNHCAMSQSNPNGKIKAGELLGAPFCIEAEPTTNTREIEVHNCTVSFHIRSSHISTSIYTYSTYVKHPSKYIPSLFVALCQCLNADVL